MLGLPRLKSTKMIKYFLIIRITRRNFIKRIADPGIIFKPELQHNRAIRFHCRSANCIANIT